MLRTGLDDTAAPGDSQQGNEPAPDGQRWRVSSGTASVLGLRPIAMDAVPTTAYLMLGERCSRNCAFCTQARDSSADAAALSRVLWPEFLGQGVAEAVADAHRRGEIGRACFQVTASPGYLADVVKAVSALRQQTDIPICCSVAPRGAEDVARLLAAGADRVIIALDAACERVYHNIKSGTWHKTLSLLERCARLYPGRIGTHLIVGLGETEREIIERMQSLHDLQVSIGLFAFTPVDGTALADRPAPPLASYRRVQAALHLIRNNSARAEQFQFAEGGALLGCGLPRARLRELLGSGEAFRTAGCADCNRPYYNERPGGVLYNYPRPLTPDEAQAEADALLASLG